VDQIDDAGAQGGTSNKINKSKTLKYNNDKKQIKK
jgi:hypothetical protein